MTSADAANQIAGWALGVAMFAAIVSLAAAGFSAWQAITAHLARTRLPPAVWAFEAPTLKQRRRILNVGGSPAANVMVLVWYEAFDRRTQRAIVRDYKQLRGRRARPHTPFASAKAIGPVPPGGSAELAGFGPRAELFGRFDGSPERSILSVLGAPVLVIWDDYRGQHQAQWVFLPWMDEEDE